MGDLCTGAPTGARCLSSATGRVQNGTGRSPQVYGGRAARPAIHARSARRLPEAVEAGR